jgi:hypothetical protein
VRAVAVCHLVADARPEREAPPVTQLGRELPLEHEKDVTALAPVVGDVPRRVVDHAHPDVSLLDRAPARDARFSRMLRDRDLRPVSRVKGDPLDLHDEKITPPPGRWSRRRTTSPEAEAGVEAGEAEVEAGVEAEEAGVEAAGVEAEEAGAEEAGAEGD